MDRIFFEEKQKLPVIAVWATASASLALCFPLIWGLYLRVVLQESWGRDSFSNIEISFSILLVAIIGGLVVWLISSISLEIKIDRGAIHYVYFPRFVKEQKVKKEMISDYEVRVLKWSEAIEISESKKLGRKSEDQVLTLKGKNVLVLNLRGGARYFIGTQNPEGVLWAMKKLMSNP